MRKKKPLRITVVCAGAIILVTVVTVLPLTATPVPVLRTGTCMHHTGISLMAQGAVEETGEGLVSRRGFVFQEEGTNGDPVLRVISLENSGLQDGDPPRRWIAIQGTAFRDEGIVKEGTYPAGLTAEQDQWASLVQIDAVDPAEVAGQTFTFGVWQWSDAPNRVRLGVSYWVGGERTDGASAYHRGDGTWRLATLIVSFPEGVTQWYLRAIHASPGDVITLYADEVFAAWGSAVFQDGEFGTGAYSLLIMGLRPDTSYRVRAFA